MPHWKLNQTYHFRGKRVAFDTFGQGEPLVLVHGTPSSSYIWRHQIRSLRRHFTVYVYDFLGYGQSEKREGQKVSLGEQTELLDELLTHWGLERPLIAGHDFGGAVTLRVHLLKKRRFKKMALLDPVALSPWGTSFVQLVRQFPQAFARLPETIYKGMLDAYIKSALYRPVSAEDWEPYLLPWLGDNGKKAFFNQISQFDEAYTDEIRSYLYRIDIPLLILWGAEDQWIPRQKGEELARIVSRSQFKCLPEAGHFVQEDQPERVTRELFAFFRAS